ncbi:hypothetical protein CDAR_100101 [Caerostris darwini]|uniref:Uncharacterized protein n=1 Tax=Caerostris darwini TaxID=1538125 RepID=A0AAV4P6C8_9ARAC|nr:hypothetical protein CDAR_100101 [Caerostris darwini]
MAAATKTETPKDVDEKTEVVEEKDFLRLFTLYSKIGNSVGEGKMSLQGAKLWLETAKILDEKKRSCRVRCRRNILGRRCSWHEQRRISSLDSDFSRKKEQR